MARLEGCLFSEMSSQQTLVVQYRVPTFKVLCTRSSSYLCINI